MGDVSHTDMGYAGPAVTDGVNDRVDGTPANGDAYEFTPSSQPKLSAAQNF